MWLMYGTYVATHILVYSLYVTFSINNSDGFFLWSCLGIAHGGEALFHVTPQDKLVLTKAFDDRRLTWRMSMLVGFVIAFSVDVLIYALWKLIPETAIIFVMACIVSYLFFVMAPAVGILFLGKRANQNEKSDSLPSPPQSLVVATKDDPTEQKDPI